MTTICLSSTGQRDRRPRPVLHRPHVPERGLEGAQDVDQSDPQRLERERHGTAQCEGKDQSLKKNTNYPLLGETVLVLF